MLRFLLRMGVRRGLFGNSRPWLIIGVAAGAARLLSRVAGGKPETVFSETLSPGATLVISHGTEDPPEIRGAG